jgi:hypothetical protein
LLFLDSHEFAICHRGCSPHAQRLSCKATFSEEIARIQYAYRGFLAVLRDDRESYLPILDIKHRITRGALSVNGLFFCNRHNFPAFADGGKEFMGVELAAVLGS